MIHRASSEARKSDDRANVRRLTDSLECLHPKNGDPTVLGLGKVRHVGVDYSRRNSVVCQAEIVAAASACSRIT
jgi:hypothetical protein